MPRFLDTPTSIRRRLRTDEDMSDEERAELEQYLEDLDDEPKLGPR